MQQVSLISPSLSSINPKLSSPCFFFSPKSTSSPSFSFTKTCSSSKLYVKCRQSDFYDSQKPSYSTDSYYAAKSPAAVGESPPKVFVGHSIYKGKAALTVEPRAPEFAALESGAFKIARDGFVLLQFAPSAGVRQYDWGRKQVFSLSVSEIGTLLSLGARDSCEFFHDPNKGKSDEGKVRKVLKVEPLPDGSGHFFNLSVQNKLLNMDESIYIPITKAEFTIIKSAFNYILPYLLGWHTFANSIAPDENVGSNYGNSRFGGDFEWSK